MKLLTLLLLLGFNSPAVSEVLQSLKTQCSQFFHPNPVNQNEVLTPTVLEGDQYKQICQHWKGNYRFATLYDTHHRIPVYSAYTFVAKKSNKRGKWMIEPQLDPVIHKDSKDMRKMKKGESGMLENQAESEDYSSKTYCSKKITRGHVFPHGYAADQAQAESTFTLTNIAPQTDQDNGKWATEVEQKMLIQIKTNCALTQDKPAYIVTGVVPGNSWLPIVRQGKSIEHGVNIPSYYWTAFTCSNNNKKVFSTAYLAHQMNEKTCTKFNAQEMKTDKLNKELTKLYNKPFSVFN